MTTILLKQLGWRYFVIKSYELVKFVACQSQDIFCIKKYTLGKMNVIIVSEKYI